MHTRCLFLVGVLVTALVACADDPTNPTLTSAEYLEQVGPVQCQRLQECDKAKFNANGGMGACVAETTRDSSPSKEGATIRKSDADACVRQIRAKTCAEIADDGAKCSLK